ncbi:MAG: EcoRV family type II restriction endonuclease [Prevotella sp.]|jgi:hypothetical protein|nr:EcoRV family type II restriction endonuclease [Prevotella sp.]MCH4216078.1 EcoRV family type II restriction endonuclease [Prevotella sp.]MCH4251889.1 EcoRV family type II restriction endonuclease [Prevotella sp.]MCI1472992.1 EcoRV family type II restriction endonuclease [Prevotella sp.]MCI1518847.1 EcoRV family type II restriction endonuclease [Prevotella sp.]
MTKEEFLNLLTKEVQGYKNFLETTNNEWIVKGFIDVNKNVYTITNDTKVVSKIIEILLIPKLDKFAKVHELELELPSKQNFYPDLTFKDKDGHLFAVDFKSSYYDSENINGLTLGSYWGYFRERDTVKSMDHTYNSYSSHTILGMLYKKNAKYVNERNIYDVDDLGIIHSVIENFIFFVQPKWKIANDIPGSGNTRNIGGITNIQKLLNGEGPFSTLGEDVFNDYWQGYFNKVDARTAGIGIPHYSNLKTYKQYLENQKTLLSKL